MEINEQLDNIYKNYNFIIGVDEVGRGCLAGPVVSCAIIMKKESCIEGVTDSKKLSKKKRLSLYDKILNECIAFGIGIVNNEIIDEINIKQASRLAMKMAIENIKDENGNRILGDFLITDAEKVDVDLPQLNLIHGDELSYVVSCASIIAKEFRDNLFVEYDELYPNYNFIKNVGYGTKAHYKGLDENGVTPIHRKTFLKKYFEKKKEYES
ncbi:MAG: ribonuclease HII [Peptoniphilaceae bacterium]|uniref:ribonuclease HII n=1 Tax=Parvimonas sp. TaxID=1944660 RepID=UPI0025D00982|nr:ribonuclease HII [Parvimonas sp.]MCI5997953.1 ribonuclease HII [Parvimonas sp.]MDD7764204.1 ribonuclease HII [Peptoniphilaceae bacterium]MDY3050409.1 ribonuclease HII [Parvimonas sp.]